MASLLASLFPDPARYDPRTHAAMTWVASVGQALSDLRDALLQKR